MMLIRRTLFGAALGLLALGAGMAAAETAEQRGLRLATEASNRNGGYEDITVSGEMILKTSGGQSATRRFDARWVTTGAGASRSMLIFRWPGDIRNTALLTHVFTGKKDDQWLYLPAMERVRRISGSGRSGSFVGSEFAFEDMADQEVDKFKHQWIAEQNCPGGGRCHVIDRFPTSKSGYSRQRIWLDTAQLRLQQVHYFDRRGAHLKTLSVSGYRQYNGRFWRSSRMDMVNHLTGARTRLNWKGYTFNQGLQKNAFTVNALRRIR
ncbi:outer membrane lipoprotein-sorting protein [Sulfitobacter mediterraneus]|jgi:outer membrane lipoprotein-sorting protein|uniref:Outer membrane lipoprotein-sorting protein n=1 Tax=Sulfitobacter mediterraneus TaxID=83219 RepID=A0A2T6CC47_9RHOB|nr:outer membrane lipoprotein-sorting protein [Sulfitobacter mediterraneus]KIN79185.1 Outer membrane lipoprotein-sorting protein [Sulfitobacter mediterraneus KCTC 32188]PTX73077.1 outer membrane lipoprotein-sorting protein [Sulfitobacter mediterraneus]UWR10450.1 outer membrane lipoprotein-sorting protein [Sulfitobacter mediterraneus]